MGWTKQEVSLRATEAPLYIKRALRFSQTDVALLNVACTAMHSALLSSCSGLNDSFFFFLFG